MADSEDIANWMVKIGIYGGLGLIVVGILMATLFSLKDIAIGTGLIGVVMIILGLVSHYLGMILVVVGIGIILWGASQESMMFKVIGVAVLLSGIVLWWLFRHHISSVDEMKSRDKQLKSGERVIIERD